MKTRGPNTAKGAHASALVDATPAMLGEGAMPSVERAADRAGISRTTAYRYFTNRRALLLATYPELEASSLLGDAPPSDPLERLELVTQRFTSHLIAHEPELRAQLRLSLDPRRRTRTICRFAKDVQSAGSRRLLNRCETGYPSTSCATSPSRSGRPSGSRPSSGSPTSPDSHERRDYTHARLGPHPRRIRNRRKQGTPRIGDQ